MGCARAAMVVDFDEPTRIDRDARVRGQEILRVRPASDRDDELVDLQLKLARGGRIDHVDRPVRDLGARDLGAQLDVEAQLPEMTQSLLGDRLIGHRQELVERLQHRHFAPQAAPNAAEFESDDAGADDAETFRHRVEFQRVPGIDDMTAVVRNRGQAYRHGPRGQNHVLGREDPLRAVARGHFDLVSREQSAVSLDRNDAAALEQREYAAGHRLDDRRTALLHDGEVERDVRGAMPCAANSCRARCRSSVDSSSAFDGMQPAFRQVPPNACVPSAFRHSSTQATFSLFCAARIAAG